jgi:ABC-2 type transport system ATP-binding protein
MEHVIETQGLTRRFGAQEAVHELDLILDPGRVLAFLGRNGAGKTTTIKMLAGLLPPTEGQSCLLGTPSESLAPGDWQRIGYVSENQQLYDWMTGAELIAFLRPLYPTWDRDLEALLVRKLVLPLDRRLSQCSRGEKMKTALVLALAFRPRLLILDEPFSGLDPLAREELLSGVLEVTGQDDWSVFFSTHDVDEVERLADEVAFIDAGRLELHEPLETLQARFRRVHVSLAVPLAETFADPAAMDIVSEASLLRFVHTRFSEDAESGLRQQFSGAQIDVATLSLREIFLVLARTFQERGLGHA